MRNITLVTNEKEVIYEFERLLSSYLKKFKYETENTNIVIKELNNEDIDELIEFLIKIYRDQVANFVLYTKLLKNRIYGLLSQGQKVLLFESLRQKVYNDKKLNQNIKKKLENILDKNDSFHIGGFMNFSLREEAKDIEEMVNNTILKIKKDSKL